MLPNRRSLVRNLIYPVPDPRFPFLGVHFTRTIHGGVEAGPNAILALKREGYRRTSVSPRDIARWAAYGGYWRMVRKYWKTGLGEFYRSLSKRAFVKALKRLIPELRREDLATEAPAFAPRLSIPAALSSTISESSGQTG